MKDKKTMELTGKDALDELERRLALIKSEPNGLVRETMIDNFLIDVIVSELEIKDKTKDTSQICYKDQKPCKYDCPGLCRESM